MHQDILGFKTHKVFKFHNGISINIDSFEFIPEPDGPVKYGTLFPFNPFHSVNQSGSGMNKVTINVEAEEVTSIGLKHNIIFYNTNAF